jgi:hypothetical protein
LIPRMIFGNKINNIHHWKKGFYWSYRLST